MGHSTMNGFLAAYAAVLLVGGARADARRAESVMKHVMNMAVGVVASMFGLVSAAPSR